MKIKYDPYADAIYIQFNNLPVKKDNEIEKDFIMDYADNNVPVGLEVLSISKKVPKKALQSIQFELSKDEPKMLKS